MSVPVQSDMRFKVVVITPTWAAELLAKNHPNNRRIKWGRVNAYARDMAQGYWRLTHQAIAVDVDGWLIDGQNRLSAVVDSGVDVPFVLVTGCSRDSILGADLGANRNVGDMAAIQGNPLPHGASSFSSIARRMAAGMNEICKLTNAGVLEFIKVHAPAIEFAFECLPVSVRGITHAPVRAVIARAYYRRNLRGRTKEFCQVLISGLPENPKEDSAAIRLKNWLQDTFLSGKRGGGKRAKASIVYAKTERALKAFHDREYVQTLIEMKRELFPITEDANAEEDEETKSVAGKVG